MNFPVQIKRRSDVLGIFPNEDAVIRLIGALLPEQNDEWALQHARYQPVDKIGPAGFVAVCVTEREADGAWTAAGETGGVTGDLGGVAALAGARLLRPAAS